jgi:hypothetical protein
MEVTPDGGMNVVVPTELFVIDVVAAQAEGAAITVTNVASTASVAAKHE